MTIRSSVKITVAMMLATLILISCGSSDINKDPGMHQQMISRSRLENSIVVSLDTVFFKGDAYCLMNTTGLSLAPFYHFSTLTGQKAIDVMPYSAEGTATSHNEYIFSGNCTGMKAYRSFSFSTIPIIETIVNNNLLSTTDLRPIDVGNFVKNNPRPPKFNPARMKVIREMAKEVRINYGYGDIYQDDRLIGKFDKGSVKSADLKKEQMVYTVKFVNLTKCATVSFAGYKEDRKKDRLMEAETEFDGKIHRLTMSEKSADWEQDALLEAVQYLIKQGYL